MAVSPSLSCCATTRHQRSPAFCLAASARQTARTLPPGVDRNRGPQRAADHLPRALCLAAGDNDVNLRGLEDLDHFVRLRLAARRVRLEDGHPARPAQVHDPLTIPVLASGPARDV